MRIRGFGILVGLHRLAVHRIRPLAHRFAIDQRGDRISQLAVPEAVERRGKLAHDRTRDQQVEVEEVRLLALHEVRITQVAPAGHRHGVVGDEHLVVHARADARHVACRSDDA